MKFAINTKFRVVFSVELHGAVPPPQKIFDIKMVGFCAF